MLTISPPAARLLEVFETLRQTTEALAAPLSAEDQCVQTMPDVSPTKWHRAHTTWFWETFLLAEHAGGYEPFNADFCFLFNSYYDQVGPRHARHRRGEITRPSCAEVEDYRCAVDQAVRDFLIQALEQEIAAAAPVIELGIGHEQQHQELLLTDIKHVLSCNPLRPAAYPRAPEKSAPDNPGLTFSAFEGGLVETGHDGTGFAYDNEGPRHKVWLDPFELADRPVTNGDYLAFVEDGGYRTVALWLSDGWDLVQSEGWEAPLYWHRDGGGWREFTLHGDAALDPAAPVCHLSFYEAQAYAEWAGLRLPSEHEWEHAAAHAGPPGRFLKASVSAQPGPVPGGVPLAHMFGGVWEWTRSDYGPYPGYRAPAGAVGEYNGKFMCGQYVLRGGSCATTEGHVRLSYRNFFPPQARWQFSGARMARDL